MMGATCGEGMAYPSGNNGVHLDFLD